MWSGPQPLPAAVPLNVYGNGPWSSEGHLWPFLRLLLFVCEKVNQSRHKHHDDLGHYDIFNEEHAVEEALWLDRDRQAVDVVQSHGWNGQGQSSWGPRKTPSTGLPVLSQAQTQKGPAVSGQRGERGCIQTNPLRVGAPFLGQRNRPVEENKHVQSEHETFSNSQNTNSSEKQKV